MLSQLSDFVDVYLELVVATVSMRPCFACLVNWDDLWTRAVAYGLTSLVER